MITPQYKCHRAAYHSSKTRAFLTNVWLKLGCCLQLELSHVTEWQIGGIEGVFRVPSTFQTHIIAFVFTQSVHLFSCFFTAKKRNTLQCTKKLQQYSHSMRCICSQDQLFLILHTQHTICYISEFQNTNSPKYNKEMYTIKQCSLLQLRTYT